MRHLIRREGVQMRHGPVVPAVCVALLATAGCTSRHDDTAVTPPAPHSVDAATPAAHPMPHATRIPLFPATIHAVTLALGQGVPGVLAIGAHVPPADVGVRVSAGGDVGFGLANRGSVFGNVYPVISADGGASWQVNGPRFSYAGADGAGTTNHVDVSGDGSVVAWGLDDNFVKTTTDRGRHWDEADFFGGVDSVKAVGDELIARALGSQTRAGRFRARRYVSRNDGRTWHRRKELPTVPY
jgi:hypothetical protein